MIYWCSLGIYPVPPIISAKTSEDIRKNIQDSHPHSPILCCLETLSNRWIHAQAELTWLFVSTKDILTIPYYPYFTNLHHLWAKKHETHWASESIMMCCSLHFPFAMFQGMTASLFPLNKCGLPGLTGPLTHATLVVSNSRPVAFSCFFSLLWSSQMISACVAIAPFPKGDCYDRNELFSHYHLSPLWMPAGSAHRMNQLPGRHNQ